MRCGALPLFLVISSIPVDAQDWPGWRGAGRDGKLAGFRAPAQWPENLVRGWQIRVGGGHSTPALVDGRLYVHSRHGEDDVLRCLDSVTGKDIWRVRYPAPYKVPSWAEMHGSGPFSSPCVIDGRLFAFSTNGILSCVDAKTGRLLWRHDFRDRFPTTAPENGTAMSPLIVDGMCIVHAGGTKKGAILALDAETGKVRWSWDGDPPAYASPFVVTTGGKRHLITQSQIHTVGLDPADGRLLWRLEFKTYGRQNSVTPVVFGNLMIHSGLNRGVSAWRIGGAEPEKVWESKEVSMYMSTPVLKGGRLFGFSHKRSGQLFCLDAKSGRTLWLGEGRQGENAAVLEAGDVILALITPKPGTGTRLGSHLVVFDAADGAYLERARYKLADTPAWAHPVVSGRSIFVKDRELLTRWVLP